MSRSICDMAARKAAAMLAGEHPTVEYGHSVGRERQCCTVQTSGMKVGFG